MALAFRIYRTVILLAFLACVGKGRRVQTLPEHSHDSSPAETQQHSQVDGAVPSAQSHVNDRLRAFQQLMARLVFESNAAASAKPVSSARPGVRLAAKVAVDLQRLRGGAAKPQQFITGTGQLKTSGASTVTDSLPSGTPVSVVSSVGRQHIGRRLLNALYSTSFDSTVQLGTQAQDAAGAWLAVSPSSPGCIVLETRPLPANGQKQSAVDSCRLTCFALALSDAIIIHSPCVSPSVALVKEMYERVFSRYLAAIMPSGVVDGRTMLVHVSDPGETLSESAVRAACMDAWSSAAAATDFEGTPLEDLFDLRVVSVPAESVDAEGFTKSIAELKAMLAGASGKVKRASNFTNVATAAWEAASTLGGEPSEEFIKDSYMVSRSYRKAYAQGQRVLEGWAPQVAKRKIISSFGPQASKMLSDAAATFDAGVSACSAVSSDIADQRRDRLIKMLRNDVQELLSKQHRELSASLMLKFKDQLQNVMGRSGNVAEWQQESLRRNIEKEFDAAVSELMVDDKSRAQLTTAFGKQLTELAAEFAESPAMQLAALGAMRRKSGRGRKPPKGVRTGVSLVGALRNDFAGGQGNIQTYGGYVDGLNSVHFMYANDGLIPDPSGSEPPLFRWQPKINFDITI